MISVYIYIERETERDRETETERDSKFNIFNIFLFKIFKGLC